MDKNKRKSQVRITAFGKLARKFYTQVKFHGVYAIKNFTVSTPNPRFHQLKNPFEIHLNSKTEIIALVDDGKFPKDLKYSFVPFDQITKLKKSCCIDLRGIVTKKTECYRKFNYWTRGFWTARDIELVDSTKHSIKLTLPGKHAENFNTPIRGLYQISGVKIQVDVAIPESSDDDDDDDEDGSSDDGDDEDSNDEASVGADSNNNNAQPRLIHSVKVMLCSDHQGDTDDGSTSGNDSSSDDNESSSSSDRDYDFDNEDDENEEEIDADSPPPSSNDSNPDDSTSSSSSSDVVSSPSTYKNSNLIDDEAMALRQWYDRNVSTLKPIPVPLCTTSISFTKKLEYAKKILDKGKKKNPKYCDSWAAKKAGVSLSFFSQYLKQFRISRPRQISRPWIKHYAANQLKELIAANGGKTW